MICKPFASANWANAIHVESVHRSGDADEGGAERCTTFESTREPSGMGDGDRSGCVDVYDLRRMERRPAVGDPGSVCAWSVAIAECSELDKKLSGERR
jgi:hypothetical protein